MGTLVETRLRVRVLLLLLLLLLVVVRAKLLLLLLLLPCVPTRLDGSVGVVLTVDTSAADSYEVVAGVVVGRVVAGDGDVRGLL